MKGTCDGCNKYREIVRQWKVGPTVDGSTHDHLELYCAACDERLFSHLHSSPSDAWDEFCKRHATAAEKALDHELVKKVIKEQYGNITQNFGAEPEGLIHYGLLKIARYAAQVARAEAEGFDPDLLRVSPERATEMQMELMAMALAADKEVFVVHPE
jgi:hypothetical protein